MAIVVAAPVGKVHCSGGMAIWFSVLFVLSGIISGLVANAFGIVLWALVSGRGPTRGRREIPNASKRMLTLQCENGQQSRSVAWVNISKKLAAPKWLPRRSPTPVLTGPCNG